MLINIRIKYGAKIGKKVKGQKVERGIIESGRFGGKVHVHGRRSLIPCE